MGRASEDDEEDPVIDGEWDGGEWEQKQIRKGGTTAADDDRAPPPKPVYKPAPSEN